MRERLNILSFDKKEPSSQERGPAQQTLWERARQRWSGDAPQQKASSRYLDILHFENDPAPERTAKAAEALGKTKTKKAPIPLGATLGWLLLKGAVELPIKGMKWILEKTPNLAIPALDMLGLPSFSLEPFDRKLYLKTFQKWATKKEKKSN